MPTPQICQSQEDALQWAKSNFPFESWKCLTDRPWAVTYRLIKGEQNASLKIVVPSVCDVSKTTPLLAKYFPKNIPRALAHDKDKGLLLLESHNSVDFDRHLSDEKKHKMITTYARIQAESAALPDIVAGGSGRINSNLLTDLLLFLSLDDQLPNVDGAMVNADYFLGKKMAAGYRDRIEHRLRMLQKFFDCGEDLPPTINHCDLRPSNAAEQEDGTCILYDWEDSTLGPAGLSLHGMLSGCSSTAMILGGKPELVKIAKRDTHSLLLDAYINELAAGNYADKNVLKTKLPALVCTGVLLYVISFCRFAKQAGSYKKVIAGNLQRRLSDLLDLCDYLAITDPDNITAYVKQLRLENSGWRQERILKWFTTYYPTCFDSYWELGHYYRNQGRRELASEAYDKALKLNPDNPRIHNRLGLTLLQACRYLVIDFGTSQSTKIDSPTRQPLCPGRPTSVPLRHTIAGSALATQHSLKWLVGCLRCFSSGARTYRVRGGQRPPSAHRTVRTGPYTAPHIRHTFQETTNTIPASHAHHIISSSGSRSTTFILLVTLHEPFNDYRANNSPDVYGSGTC